MLATNAPFAAILLLLFAMFSLGSWPFLLHMASHRGRMRSHAYLDYCLTFYVVAIVCALTLGQLSDPVGAVPNFIQQLREANSPVAGLALAGGFMLSAGNLCIQHGISLIGMTICPSITAAMTIIIGTTTNWFLDHEINAPELVFPAVGCCLVAILCGAFAKVEDAKAQAKKAAQADLVRPLLLRTSAKQAPGTDYEAGSCGVGVPQNSPKLPAGDVAVPIRKAEDEEDTKASDRRKRMVAGLLLSFLGGTCLGCFSPLFNLASNDQLHTLRPGVPPLGVYTGYFYFATGFFATSVLINMAFMYWPTKGNEPSCITDYITNCQGRAWALLAGTLCGLGNVAQFMGGQTVGYAAANIAQAKPLITAVWAVLVFREFRGTSWRALTLLCVTFAFYLASIGLLAGSVRQIRQP